MNCPICFDYIAESLPDTTTCGKWECRQALAPAVVETRDHIDDFMAAIAEWTALQTYRLAHFPLAPNVPPDELEAYSRAKRALRDAIAAR
jgi:hypothetical protein